MNKRSQGKTVSRRHFFKLTGGSTLFAAGMGLLPFKNLLGPLSMAEANAQAVTVNPPPDLYFGGTDGWISLPKSPVIHSASLGGVKTHPDDLAPIALDTADGKGLTTYIFGFRNVTGLSDAQRAAQKNHAQHNAPMFWLDQYNPASPRDFRINLTNLGLALRPDLFDAHTIHWHGFRNVITFFDGEPTGSIAVTAGRVFQYVYRPRDPGTYMFHCHVEDVEHVHMGMTGPVFVRALQNSTGGGVGAPVARLGGNTDTSVYVPLGYAYNDGVPTSSPMSTAYDREFAIFCSEVWGDSHWADAHIQLPEWSDYRADFSLLNGRVYPDTLAPHAPMNMPLSLTPGIHAMPVVTDADGDLTVTPGYEYLKYQPLSALVTCNAGDRVLLRFANLGFKESAMTLDGPRLRVVGKDATPMRGVGADGVTRNGADTSYEASTVSFGAGESIDAIFVAPAFSGGTGTSGQGYDVYLLYDRAYERSNNLAATGTGLPYGGRQTEVRVYPGATLPQQLLPNT
ncbi:MAG: multicopper oxidase domain-containing protein [Steroidobacteraceae bacterium]